jgi:acylphosphatase
MGDVTLRYHGEAHGVDWPTAETIFGKIAQGAQANASLNVQYINYHPTTKTLADGTTVDGWAEGVVTAETTEADLSTTKEKLARAIVDLGVTSLASSKSEAKADMTTDLFSVSRARIEGAVNEQGINATRAEIQSVLDTMDQQKVKDGIKSDLTYERWDRSSPVNGTPASQMEARENVPDSAPVYIVRDSTTGQTIYFQYVDPINGGNLTESNWESVAQQHIDQIAEKQARSQVIEDVTDKL